MPRPAKGARLWYDRASKLWYIRDGTSKRGTGCGLAERAGAEEALRAYIEEKYEPPSDSRPDRVLVADVLTYYAREVAPGLRSQASGYAIERLLEWWQGRPLADVKRSTCQAYVAHRAAQPIRQAKKMKNPKLVSPETARRELAVLRSAIRAYHAETPLDAVPIVTLPDPSQPRDRWLTRSEAAALLRAARNLADADSGRALVRFVLVSLYTGTRSGALRRTGWLPNTVAGWIDVDRGVIHRRSAEDRETKKRRPPIRTPARLAGFLRRWRAADMIESDAGKPVPFLIHYRRKPVEKQRKAWAEACRVAGLGTEVVPHILRHTAVTWMMQSGADVWDVSAYAGMSVEMLEKVYGHHHPDYQSDIANRIGRRQ